MEDLTALLARMKRLAEVPLDEATSLPPEIYSSPQMLTLEIERIWRREWVCAGRVDEIPRPGDWFCFELIGEPMIVVRGTDGEIRALSNICAHRWAALKMGRGNSSTLQCPFHAWTYDLNGCLRSAPFMDRAKGFVLGETRLPAFRVELWHGFIFVNLDAQAEPLAPRLAGLTAKLAALNVVDQKTLWHDEEQWDANWKTVIEQTMESYHLFQVHQKTLDPHTPTKSAEYLPGAAGYNHHTVRFTRPVAPATPIMWRATIYPSVVIDVGDSLSWTTVIPDGLGRSRVYTGQATLDAPEPGSLRAKQFVSGGQAFNARLNNEDRSAVETVQRGLQSRHRRPGRLSHLEGTVWEFGQYLVRQLVG